MNRDVRKLFRNVSQMRVEPLVSASVFPAQFDLFGCVTEDGAEPVPYPNLVTEFLFDRGQPHLRDVCPYAQHIGKTGDFNSVHFSNTPRTRRYGNQLHCRCILNRKADLAEIVIDLGQGPQE